MDHGNVYVHRKCPGINMRHQQQGQPCKDLIPSSCRLRLVIIADIGKGSTILEVLALICYRGLEPVMPCKESSHVALAPQPGHNTLFGW